MTDIARLDLNLLLLLDDLLATGNLSATARHLRMSQPSASAGLSELRRFFNDDLFVRTGRGMRPTAFALGLRNPVHSVIETVRHEVLARSTFAPLDSARVFTLTMPDLSEVVFLSPILATLHDKGPRIRLRCLDVPYEHVKDSLEQNLIDLAIGYFPDLTEPAIRSELLHEDRFVCIARAGHPELRGRVSLDQFLELNHVTIIGEGRQESYDRWIRKLAPKREPRLRVSHFMSIPALVATTDMVSVVPQSLADTFAPLFGLQVFDPPIALPKIPVKQFWSRSMQAEPGLCWLRGLVAERFIRSNMRDASDRAPTPKSMSR